MKRISTLTMLVGLGVLATGACGDDRDGDTNATKPRAGNAGRGGGGASGAGGAAARAGDAGRGGSAALSGKGGSEPITSGRGGSGGSGAAGSSGRGGSSRGGTGGGVKGGASGAAGAGAGGDAGTGGEGGGPSCFGATAHGWGDITPSSGRGLYAKYASFFESSAFPGRDAVLELWTFLPDTGRFELGKGDNANWATCMQCVIARVDDVNNPNRLFFADAGVLSIDDASDPIAGVLEADITGAHFVEVTVADAYPYESTPVEGGTCLEGLTTHISVGNAPPGGAGGAGGQGGAGGEGGDGGYAGAFEVPTGCIEVNSGSWVADVQPAYGRYISAIAPNLGSSAQDHFILAFFDDAVGTSRIGHGADSRFSSCERCFIATIPNNTSDGLWFYGVEGTLTVDSGSTPMSGVLDATATDVTFTQVDPYDLETPVENGDCLHLATATIALP